MTRASHQPTMTSRLGSPARSLRLCAVGLACGVVALAGGPVAASAADSCPNAEIRQQQPRASHLADCRAYEKASPADKNSTDIDPWGLRAVSPDGDRAVFYTHAAGPGATNGVPTLYLGSRDGDGWSSRTIDPAAGSAPKLPVARAFSDDLTASVILSYRSLAAGGTDGAGHFYRLDLFDGSFGLGTPIGLPGALEPFLAANSPDVESLYYEHGVAQADVPETGAPPNGQLSTYKLVDGATSAVGVLPDGSTPPDGSRAGSGLSFGSVERALSADGARAVFHAIELAKQNNHSVDASVGGQLYVREDRGVGTPHTWHVTASERSTPDPAGPLPALYWTAEAQHTDKVLFTSCEQLTDDSRASTNVGTVSGEGCADNSGLHNATEDLVGRDLYLYDLTADGGNGDLIDLTTLDPTGGKVFGVIGSSENLDRIYFVAGGVLAPGATADDPNLYLREGSTTKFIGTLDRVDAGNWAVSARQRLQESRVSPDGRYLVFTTVASLAGEGVPNPSICPPTVLSGPDNTPNTPDDIVWNSEGRCAEVHRYDAVTGEVLCLSCNAEERPASGNAALTRSGGGGASLTPDPAPTNLSPDGRRVYFQTPDALVSRDSNGRVDVYQWSDGEVSLVSSGRSTENSHFVDATPSGSDVLFLTRERLVSWDRDTNVDLYDARAGGGFPESTSVPECSGDDCHGALPDPPRLMDPASDAFSGVGNVGAAPRLSVSVGRVSRRGRMRLAAGQAVTLRIRANRSGRAVLSARANLGAGPRVVGSVSRRLRAGQSVRLRLQLSKPALRHLARVGRLRIAVAVRFSGVSKRQALTLTASGKGR